MSAEETVNSTIFKGDEFFSLEESTSSGRVQLETPAEEEAPLNSTFRKSRDISVCSNCLLIARRVSERMSLGLINPHFRNASS